MLIKICGLTREQDLALAQELGVDFCGFIFHNKSPRAVDASWVGACASGSMKRVGVFVTEDVQTILKTMETARLDYAQLHARQSALCAQAIGPARVIRVLWPEAYATRADLLRAIEQTIPHAAYLLFDTGRSGGGHGRAFSEEHKTILRDLALPLPWFLAGGLGPENLREALDLHPNGLDLNSALEDAPGCKNHERMRRALALIGEHKRRSLDSRTRAC